MKKIALIAPVVIALVLIGVYLYLNPYVFQSVTTISCEKSDAGCIKDLDIKKDDCIPSSTIINGRDGISLMVNITREGDGCIRTEEVITSEKAENNYLVGKNVTCEYELSQMDNASSTACKGSLYEYVVPSGGAGGSGADFITTPSQPGNLPQMTCRVDDQACKQIAAGYIDNCTNYEIVNSEATLGPSGFWTLLIRINRLQDYCAFYYEVLNAVDLPPGIPTTIIGSSMTCDVPFSALPIENLTVGWCRGDFYQYLYP